MAALRAEDDRHHSGQSKVCEGCRQQFWRRKAQSIAAWGTNMYCCRKCARAYQRYGLAPTPRSDKLPD